MKRNTVILVCTALLLIFSIDGFSVVANYWNNTAGDNEWNNAANWSTGRIPSPLDDSVNGDEAKIRIGAGPVIDTGDIVEAFRVFVGMDGTNYGQLTIDGGTLTTTGYLSSGYHVGNTATVTMNSGYVRLGTLTGANGHFYCGRAGQTTFNMNGGTMDIMNTFFIARDATANNVMVNLDGGIVTASTLSMRQNVGAVGNMNITGGKLILQGDDTATVANYLANGWITGYGSEDNIVYDYNITTPGKTTVWAVPEPATISLLCAGLLGLIRRKG
ncbi:MAG: PEP-CTERM sorting domain-containing protein [Planctomycetaceae bacterium]|nr:PEP-CTERM sorting domain-containing protein [Planctomycetaceae bacterium]